MNDLTWFLAGLTSGAGVIATGVLFWLDRFLRKYHFTERT